MRLRPLIFSVLLTAAAALPAQEQDLSKVEIKSAPLGAHLYLLRGLRRQHRGAHRQRRRALGR